MHQNYNNIIETNINKYKYSIIKFAFQNIY